MTQDSLTRRHEVFVGAGVIAAHSSNADDGFRLRDARFFCELFSNWGDAALQDDVLKIQNTQVMRYLSDLIRDNFARRRLLKRTPRYQLTRIGLVEILSRLLERSYSGNPAAFFFLYFFIRNYRHRIDRLVRMEGAQFPPALQVRIESLLDVKAFLARERADLNRRLKKASARLEYAKNSSALVTSSVEMGIPFDRIAKELERKYPYNLNSQKPLSQLLREIPHEQGIWEVQYGNLRRCDQMWEPLYGMLEKYAVILAELESRSRSELDTPLND